MVHVVGQEPLKGSGKDCEVFASFSLPALSLAAKLRLLRASCIKTTALAGCGGAWHTSLESQLIGGRGRTGVGRFSSTIQ